MPGYDSRELVDEEVIPKGNIGFDFEKVDVITVTNIGVEYTPTLPSGSALVNMSTGLDITPDTKVINFDTGLGMANTMEFGFIQIGSEIMEIDSNTGVGPTLTSGDITIKKRGARGTKVVAHVNFSPIAFLWALKLVNRQACVVWNETDPEILWINPEDFTLDTGKSYPVTSGAPMYSSKSAVNSWFMFAGGANPITVRVLNCW